MAVALFALERLELVLYRCLYALVPWFVLH
jgi:hypothetical protein